MRRAAPLLAVLLAGLLAACGDEPSRTVVIPPKVSLPEDAPLRPQAAAPAPNSAPANSAPAANAVPVAPQATAPLPAVRQAGDAQGAELLAQRSLQLPVVGVTASALSDHYELARGKRVHEAIDIMAATGTPVVAVDDGRIAKLFTSKAGGYTVYHFDPSGRLAYYYAHLDRYADGLKEGMEVHRGDLLGYVGSSGNANPQAPHLHFAVFRLGTPARWWEGEPVNPYPALSRAAPSQQLASR